MVYCFLTCLEESEDHAVHAPLILYCTIVIVKVIGRQIVDSQCGSHTRDIVIIGYGISVNTQ